MVKNKEKLTQEKAEISPKKLLTTDLGKIALASATLGSTALASTTDWGPMSKRYELKPEDEQSGLAEFLYEARDIAASALDNLFLQLGIDTSTDFCQSIYKIPIGLDRKSDIPGAYEPGRYGIPIGGKSKEIQDFLKDGGLNREKIQRKTARTIAHEMIHAFQTVRATLGNDNFYFNTLGGVEIGKGLEEGMAEALSNIAIQMQRTGVGLKEAAEDYEDYCAENDMPATQKSARLIQNMSTGLLKWYLTCGQTGEWETNNKLKKAFGPSYTQFCRNMDDLYNYEIGNDDNAAVA